MYDVIGDIHGHARELEALLAKLGYARRKGCWRHPDRQAVFLGDLIDRGPEIRRVLETVRPMVEEGSARIVLGNHEWNALGMTTPDPEAPGAFCRRHNAGRVEDFRPTRDALGRDLPDWLEWFRHLPFYLDLDGIRVVHASWHPEHLAVLDDRRAGSDRISDALIAEGFRRGTALFEATETVLKGQEQEIPGGAYFLDKDGRKRRETRIRWFEAPDGRPLRQYSLPERPEIGLEHRARAEDGIHPYPASAPPVFVGHYWLTAPEPEPLAPNVACLDYSVAKEGYLCAYRWDGEATLRREHFVCA